MFNTVAQPPVVCTRACQPVARQVCTDMLYTEHSLALEQLTRLVEQLTQHTCHLQSSFTTPDWNAGLANTMCAAEVCTEHTLALEQLTQAQRGACRAMAQQTDILNCCPHSHATDPLLQVHPHPAQFDACYRGRCTQKKVCACSAHCVCG
jgi:hypothetical protein